MDMLKFSLLFLSMIMVRIKTLCFVFILFFSLVFSYRLQIQILLYYKKLVSFIIDNDDFIEEKKNVADCILFESIPVESFLNDFIN